MNSYSLDSISFLLYLVFSLSLEKGSIYKNIQYLYFYPLRKYLLPIPQSEIDVNSKMIQNNGY